MPQCRGQTSVVELWKGAQEKNGWEEIFNWVTICSTKNSVSRFEGKNASWEPLTISASIMRAHMRKIGGLRYVGRTWRRMA